MEQMLTVLSPGTGMVGRLALLSALGELPRLMLRLEEVQLQ